MIKANIFNDFYEKQVHELSFTLFLQCFSFFRFLQTKISKYLSEFWACYFYMTTTALGLKRSKRLDYCFIYQEFETSEVEVF